MAQDYQTSTLHPFVTSCFQERMVKYSGSNHDPEDLSLIMRRKHRNIRIIGDIQREFEEGQTDGSCHAADLVTLRLSVRQSTRVEAVLIVIVFHLWMMGLKNDDCLPKLFGPSGTSISIGEPALGQSHGPVSIFGH